MIWTKKMTGTKGNSNNSLPSTTSNLHLRFYQIQITAPSNKNIFQVKIFKKYNEDGHGTKTRKLAAHKGDKDKKKINMNTASSILQNY